MVIINVRDQLQQCTERNRCVRGGPNIQNFNSQIGATYAMIKALNNLTGLAMPVSVCCVKFAQ